MALALVASVSQANAELLKNFKFGGSVELAAVSARNVETFRTRATNNAVPADHVGSGQTRILLNMDWDLLDDVHAKITLRKNNRVYGNPSETAVTGAADSFRVDQGYFKIDKVFGLLDMTFGRQFFGEPGDLIAYFGPKDSYALVVTAVDGVRADWAGEKAYATVVAFQPDANAQNLNQGTENGNTDIRGFIVGNKGDEHIDAKVYLWNAMIHGAYNDVGGAAPGTGTKNDNLFVLGGKVKAKYGGVYGSLEAAINFGENRTNSGAADGLTRPYSGKALLADVGMKADVEQIGTFNPWALFGWGTGNGDNTADRINHNMDFTPIATDFRPGALYGRFEANNPNVNFGGVVAPGSASQGLTNRIIMGAGVKATPSALNKLTAGLAVYNIRLQNIGSEVTPAGVTNLAFTTGGHRSIGQEYDATAEWKHSENVSLKGTLANFQPGDAIRYIGRANALNSAWMSAFDVAVKF
ncbi:MAG: alginate export family protein [Elusimicrobia bacterium]|nr:alginate export family protein [Elusimicrobiota bacterium]